MSPRVLDMTEGEGLRRCVLLRNAFRLSRSLEASHTNTLGVEDIVGADSGYAEVRDAAEPYTMSVGVSDYDFGDEGESDGTTTAAASEAQWFDELLLEMGSAQLGDIDVDAQEDDEAEDDSDDELSDDDEELYASFSRSTTRKPKHPLAQVWPRRTRSRSSASPAQRSPKLDSRVAELAGLELDLSDLSTLTSAIAPSTPATSLSSSASSIDECPALVRDDGEDDDSSDSELESDEGHGSSGPSRKICTQAVDLRQHHSLSARSEVDADAERYQNDLRHFGRPGSSHLIAASPSSLEATRPSSSLKSSPSSSPDLLRSVSSIRALSESAWRRSLAAASLDDEEREEEEEVTTLWERRERIRAW